MATVRDLANSTGFLDAAVVKSDAQLSSINTALTSVNTNLNTLNTTTNSIYPVGATPITSSSGNVANAPAVATFPAVPGKTNYVESITMNGGGATAAAIVSATLTGAISGTMTFTYGVVAGPTAANTPRQFSFSPPIPASAVNTALTLTLPALGAGNTNATVNMVGYYI